MRTIKFTAPLLIALLSALSCVAQTKNYHVYKERAEQNLKYLSNDIEIANRVQIDSKGIIIYTDDTKTKRELVLYWTDLPKFVDIIENWDYYDMVKTFGQKGQQAFSDQYGMKTEYFHWYKELPESWEDLNIAIDPGHFGGNLEEANYEMRFAKFRGQDVGQKKDVFFHEADLTYSTALILQEKLKVKGANVMITRPYGTSALGKSFKKWLVEDYAKDLEESKKKGDITKQMYEILKDTSTHERLIFENFYKFVEFRKRISKINEFKPHITFVLHYNAQEGNKRFGERYLKPVDNNYHMAFVPGAFQAGELVKTDAKVDFIRLLVSQDLPNSLRLANMVMKHTASLTNVPVIPRENDLNVLKDVSIPTEFEGVYSRNLALTRLVRGVIVYGEFFYQDNKEELLKLAAKDYEVQVPGGPKIKTSKRCAEVADAHLISVDEYLSANKVLKVKQAEALANVGASDTSVKEGN